jgi:hypothetical protein
MDTPVLVLLTVPSEKVSIFIDLQLTVRFFYDIIF